jgi:hypothetical protein
MNKKIVAVSFLIVAILFVSAIAETIVYYKGEISNLKSQITKLNAIITNLPTAHLVTSLGINEMLGNDSNEMGTPTPIPYNYLYMTGSVINTGNGTAYNAGLHVVAHNVTGTLEINMTVPLSGGIYGTDNATNAFILKNYGSNSPPPVVIEPEQTAYFESGVSINILHEDTVSNWTVTLVWTNTP